MRKQLLTFSISLLLLSFLTFPTYSFGQCGLTISASDTLICPGDTVSLSSTLSPATVLTTTFSSGNNHRGNMFDITAINTVTITSFDCYPMGATSIEVYWRPGTHVGNESSISGWTQVGSAVPVTPVGGANPTPIPLNINVTIPAGQTYSFYVTSTNTSVSLNYSNGTSRGNVYSSDGNIQFLEGSGMEYPFTAGGSIFQPRIWNGRIHYNAGSSYTWSTGDTTSSVMVMPTATTTYSLNAIFNGGSCNESDSVTIQVDPAPVVSLGNDTIICAGDSLMLDAGAGGTSYLWSDGSSGQTISANASNNYCVTVANAAGCETIDCVNLNVNTPPSVNLGADRNLCEGTPQTLDAGAGGASYMWSNGATTQTIQATVGGSYSVDVTDSAGCVGTDDLNLNFVASTAYLGPDTSYCAGSSINLGPQNPGSGTCTWSTGDTTMMITVSSPGTYVLNCNDTSGCLFSDSINISEETAPTSSFTFTPTSAFDVDFTSTSTGATSYFWDFDDGNTSTQMNPTHTFLPGGFNVMLVVTNACGSDTSYMYLDIVSTESGLAAGSLNLFPNPGNNQFVVNWSGMPTGQAQLVVTNLQGKALRSYTVELSTAEGQQRVEMTGLASGMYLVSLQTENSKLIRKWIKR